MKEKKNEYEYVLDKHTSDRQDGSVCYYLQPLCTSDHPIRTHFRVHT